MNRHPAPRIVALIPARSGSRRVPGKNVRELAGHPLIAYTICAARESGVFSSVLVSTDDARYAEIARHYGAQVPFLRPASMAGELSPDIEWVEHALNWLEANGSPADAFSILRPTSPFRKAETIRRAWMQFRAEKKIDSMRAVEKCSQHPAKMWRIEEDRLRPLLESPDPHRPWHSMPYAALPPVYAQNASLEMAWCRVVTEGKTISGTRLAAFFTSDEEGFDINNPSDWILAEAMLQRGLYRLPAVDRPAYRLKEMPDAA